MGRIIIFTGKGGVGKTSVAAAHAVKSAQEGKKTLLVSADMAHNLGDIFRMEVGGKARQAAENLYLQELDPDVLMREEFPNANKAIAAMLSGSGFSANALEGNFFLPGFENLFSLLKIDGIYESGEYERIFIDCAPTGETLSLLKLPELLAWYMEKFFPVGKTMVRLLSPVAKAKYKVDLPNRKAMNEIEELHGKLMQLQELLKDDTICSVRLVCIPEKMVVEETKRNFMYLNLYDYQVDGVYINRILPAQADNPFLQKWQDIQKKYIDELERVFADIPVTRIPWYPKEVRGQEAVERLCGEILTAEDLFDVRVHTEKESYETVEGGYCLVLQLQQATEKELKVLHHDMDVEIKLNNFSRCIPLPNTLRGAEMTDVTLRDGELRICFAVKERESGEEVPQ